MRGGTVAVPRVSGGSGKDGHLGELQDDPVALMYRVHQECGPVGRFQLGQRDVVLVSGADAQELFFRAPDDVLDEAEAYPFMKPIFGEGVVFDATPEERREMFRTLALQDKQMRGYSAIVAEEARAAAARLDEHGELDMLDWFTELTIYTSTACLIGRKFRRQIDHRFAELFQELSLGTDPVAYADPYAPIESLHRRDVARAELVELVQGIMETRRSGFGTGEDSDLLDLLMSLPGEDGGRRFSTDVVTGIFISMMFAGHHTTSGTAAWTVIELLRRPDQLGAVEDELEEAGADDGELNREALRAMPRLEAVIKEVLRLHPPLILLMRVATKDLDVLGFSLPAGTVIAVSPAVSGLLAEHFPAPGAFQPERYLGERAEDRLNPWTWVPFGAGRHGCIGAQFALMQLKAIFSVLLGGFELELAQPAESYREDRAKLVVQPAQPCLVRYRRRDR